jgi:Tol biopolymer transport system component
MEWLKNYTMTLMLVGLVSVIIFTSVSVKADYIIEEPTNLGPAINCDFDESGASLSADGLSLFFDSDYPKGSDWNLDGDWDLFVVTRETLDADWGLPVNLGPAINRPDVSEWDASISADGRELYFSRGSRTQRQDIHQDLYVANRETTDSEWSTAVNLSEINTTRNEGGASISADGLSLYFASDRKNGPGDRDLYVAMRPTKNDTWSVPINLGATINGPSDDFAPSIASDGLTLIFSSTRPGNYTHDVDLWMTRRKNISDPWSEPLKLGQIVNTQNVHSADISPDGSTLYLSCLDRAGGFGCYDIWQASIIPIVDLDGNGIVNAADMGVMVDYWGTDNSLCDIGPMPWGDGIVDVQDLTVLAEHLFEEVPMTQ